MGDRSAECSEAIDMVRMYAKRKGKSGSTKPHNESPEWSNTDAAAVKPNRRAWKSRPLLRSNWYNSKRPTRRSRCGTVLGGKISAVLAENEIP